MRIGHGYDIHRLTENRDLVLGGVLIPHEKGLLGHSDADVLIHAVMDSLLGAMALPDIGHLFPDTDPQYQNISSMILLEKVANLIQEHHYTIVNLDCTVLAEAPKLAPFIDMMRDNIAHILRIGMDQVGIKATTEEGLGPVGEKRGIAAHCVCLLS